MRRVFALVLVCAMLIGIAGCAHNEGVSAYGNIVTDVTEALVSECNASEASEDLYETIVVGRYKTRIGEFKDGIYCTIKAKDFDTYLQNVLSNLDAKPQDIEGIFLYIKALDISNVLVFHIISFKDGSKASYNMNYLNESLVNIRNDWMQNTGGEGEFNLRIGENRSDFMFDLTFGDCFIREVCAASCCENILGSFSLLINQDGEALYEDLYVIEGKAG